MSEKEIKLSIIIVSYHAIDFLKLTLFSVAKALENVNGEVLLVDNSNDTQLQKSVSTLFPFVKIIATSTNLGFAKANNKALKIASGDVALLLNPDTIVAEDTFIKMINHFKNHNTGGLGARMIDGSGNFLPESKRNFPTLSSSVLKILKFHRLFPNLLSFYSYYANHLPSDKAGIVEILSGAFLAMPRKKDGSLPLFDEAYFMYGEDIDLSVQLRKEFGNNYYHPDITIIHFKGQSTPKNRNILWHFYHSMWLFYRKYIKSSRSIFTTALVWLSVRCVYSFKAMATLISKPKANNSNIDPKTVALISDNQNLVNKLRQHFPDINLYTHVANKQNEPIIIFDPHCISNYEMINFMSNYNYQYGFINNDYSSLIICPVKGVKGNVIAL